MKLNFSIVDKAKQAFEMNCMKLLVSAYHISVREHIYATNWVENDFTFMLDEYIDNSAQRVEWEYNCNIEHHLHNANSKKTKGYANSADRIDMRMTTFEKGIEYRFYVEAKRLKENDSKLLKRYIDTGINHYITKKYPHGILLGYLVKGDVDATIQKLNNILQKNNRRNEMLVRMPNSIHNQYFESTHANFGVIKHFVFDYSK